MPSLQKLPVRKLRMKNVVHRSNHYHRTKIKDAVGRREKIFARAWEEENSPLQRFSFGRLCSKLEELMMQNDCLVPVSQEAVTAAATVIQWLGAPIGFSFLELTLRKAGYRIVPIKKSNNHRPRAQQL